MGPPVPPHLLKSMYHGTIHQKVHQHIINVNTFSKYITYNGTRVRICNEIKEVSHRPKNSDFGYLCKYMIYH